MTDNRIIKAGMPLSRREREVCDDLCLGLSNGEIAQKLGIAKRTVEDHRYHIYTKMAVRNSVELLRKVFGIPQHGPRSTPHGWVQAIEERVGE